MPSSVLERLNAYSTRARDELDHETRGPRTGACLTAAAGATLALASGADADIIYSGAQNLFLSGSASYAGTPVDIDGDLINDFVFRIANSSSFPGPSTTRRQQSFEVVTSGTGNRVLSTTTLKRFYSGAAIPGPSAPNTNFAGTLFLRNETVSIGGLNGSMNGQWAGTNTGYGFLSGFVGVQVGTGTDVNYGWVRVNVSTQDGELVGGEIVDWAFETDTNVPIIAGVIPEASSLALLAAGAAGLAALRRFRKNGAAGTQ